MFRGPCSLKVTDHLPLPSRRCRLFDWLWSLVVISRKISARSTRCWTPRSRSTSEGSTYELCRGGSPAEDRGRTAASHLRTLAPGIWTPVHLGRLLLDLFPSTLSSQSRSSALYSRRQSSRQEVKEPEDEMAAEAAPPTNPVLEPTSTSQPRTTTKTFPSRPPRSHQPLLLRLRPAPTTLLVALLLLRLKSRLHRLRVPEPLKWFLWGLAVANWRSFPGVWSATVGGEVWKRWARYLVLGRKVLNDTIGVSPFEATSFTHHVASFNASAFARLSQSP